MDSATGSLFEDVKKIAPGNVLRGYRVSITHPIVLVPHLHQPWILHDLLAIVCVRYRSTLFEV
jgi:hypothetical protein